MIFLIYKECGTAEAPPVLPQSPSLRGRIAHLSFDTRAYPSRPKQNCQFRLRQAHRSGVGALKIRNSPWVGCRKVASREDRRLIYFAAKARLRGEVTTC